MDYTNINFKTEYRNYTNAMDNGKRWKFPFDNNFIPHILPLLSSIPIERNESGKLSPTRIIQKLKDMSNVNTPNGDMSASNLGYLLMYLYDVPRSKLSHISAIKKPDYAGLTPLPMLAMKLHHNIMYDEWDHKDKNMKYFIGKFLEPILLLKGGTFILTPQDIKRNRDQALTAKTGSAEGVIAPLTNYKCNITEISTPAEDGTYEYTPFPKPAMFMLLQLWIANAALRKPGYMILDPFKWDNVPKAHDEVVDKKEDRPWGIEDADDAAEIEIIPWT